VAALPRRQTPSGSLAIQREPEAVTPCFSRSTDFDIDSPSCADLSVDPVIDNILTHRAVEPDPRGQNDNFTRRTWSGYRRGASPTATYTLVGHRRRHADPIIVVVPGRRRVLFQAPTEHSGTIGLVAVIRYPGAIRSLHRGVSA
jgi:hypothetical protein